VVFNSLTFLLFLAAILLVTRSPLGWRGRKGVLLLGSYAFYAAWNPPFVGLLWLSTIVDFLAAGWMAKTASKKLRRSLLLLSLSTNLGLLAFFKYGNFVLENFTVTVQALGVAYEPARLDVILPIGISFYTFQTLSYTIDVYRGRLKPTGSFLDFALYVSFFPQLVAGPIVRASEFLPQCTESKRANASQLGWGFTLFLIGLFQKIVLADVLLAPAADHAFAQAGTTSGFEAWTGVLAFSSQIFCDFAGYSTCAIGIALTLGFVLPDNFRRPYGALGFSDFWRRWHISLSTWLRDYLYIPLGGNRQGSARTYVNLSATMLLGGLWHGASWNFVIWGALHGVYLMLERILVRRYGANPIWSAPVARALIWFGTFSMVLITWVFFRAATLSDSVSILEAMFFGRDATTVLPLSSTLAALAATGILLVSHVVMRHRSVEEVWARLGWRSRSLLLSALLLSLFLSQSENRAFIYFQF